jgi:hypothetical protein
MSIVASKNGGAAKAEQASATLKAAVSPRRVNIKMSRNILIISLNSNIGEENSADCQYIITQLQSVVGNINTSSNSEQMYRFSYEHLQSESFHDHIQFIISKHCF